MFWFNAGQNEMKQGHTMKTRTVMHPISLKLVIISVTLMSLKCDSGVIL